MNRGDGAPAGPGGLVSSSSGSWTHPEEEGEVTGFPRASRPRGETPSHGPRPPSPWGRVRPPDRSTVAATDPFQILSDPIVSGYWSEEMG